MDLFDLSSGVAFDHLSIMQIAINTPSPWAYAPSMAMTRLVCRWKQPSNCAWVDPALISIVNMALPE